MEQNVIYQSVANKTIETFGLFKGGRTKEQDEAILAKILEQCYWETLKFLEDNLSQKDQEEFIRRLENMDTLIHDEHDGGLKIVLDLFSVTIESIPDAEFRLERRLIQLVDNLFSQSAMKHIHN